jgi:hypothetical protein
MARGDRRSVGPEIHRWDSLASPARVVGTDRIVLHLSREGMRRALGVSRHELEQPTNGPEDDELWTATVPFNPARRGRQLKLVVPGTSTGGAPDRSPLTAIARAWDWAERLKSSEVATIAEICAAEGFTDTYVGQVLPLAFLAPDLVERILAGQQPARLTANKLIWAEKLPISWEEQRVAFDGLTATSARKWLLALRTV